MHRPQQRSTTAGTQRVADLPGPQGQCWHGGGAVCAPWRLA